MRPEPQALSACEEADLVTYVRAGLLVVLTFEEHAELSGWAAFERFLRTPPRYPSGSPAAQRERNGRRSREGLEAASP